MIKISDSEWRFMDILWDSEPANSMELVRLCKEKLGWKKPTTYTVIRRLGERGAVKNENTIVTALVRRDEVQQSEAKQLIDRIYGGSASLFLASFLRREKLTANEAAELKELIDGCTETKDNTLEVKEE